MKEEYIIIIAPAAINIITFLLFGYDKAVSKTGNVKLRVSERNLLLFSFIGPFGAFCGMFFFRHKTRHTKFRVLIPLFLVIQVICIFIVYFLK